MDYRKTTLENGLRLITVPDENTKAVTVLVLVGAGSKYETRELNGISHFLEHMFFKGTKKRPSKLQIAEILDRIGGLYNAFTSKELTGYFAKVQSKHFEIALDWVSDIFLNSKIESKDIEKEKGVITEEINMYLDTPVKYIGDLWEELLYGDQPAGWKTIGTKENVLSFRRDQFTSYLKNHYSASNTIVCVAGNFDTDEIASKVEEYFESIWEVETKDKKKVSESQEEPQTLSYFKETDQSHLHLGVRGYNLFDSERYAQGVLSIILGGNMSSRLFMSVREEKGLAYYVRTSSEAYTDSGYLVTAAGVPHRNVGETVELILKEYRDIKEKGVSEEEIGKAKEYLKGSLSLGLESSDSKASYYGIQELLTEEILTPEEKFDIIDKVSINDIKKIARKIFVPEKLNLALIGPHEEDKFKNTLEI